VFPCVAREFEARVSLGFSGCGWRRSLAVDGSSGTSRGHTSAELAALRPEDIDLDACTVRVTRQLYYHGAGYSFRPPKSRAGVRVVAFPELILPDVRQHMDWLPSSAALVFASSTGSPLSHSNFRNRVWLPGLAAVGLEGVHLHDLRHTGNQLTANAGANLKELMARMSHDSERAALIYLHDRTGGTRQVQEARYGQVIWHANGTKPPSDA
jgi:integrase